MLATKGRIEALVGAIAATVLGAGALAVGIWWIQLKPHPDENAADRALREGRTQMFGPRRSPQAAPRPGPSPLADRPGLRHARPGLGLVLGDAPVAGGGHAGGNPLIPVVFFSSAPRTDRGS